MGLRHFLQFSDFSREEHEHLFARTRWIKAKFKSYERYWPLEDRTLAMIFEKPSTRTRMSFEAGMHQLGGAAIYLFTRDSQLGRGESVEDAAQVISRMCDVIMLRCSVCASRRSPMPWTIPMRYCGAPVSSRNKPTVSSAQIVSPSGLM